MYHSERNVLSKENERNSCFCREIIYHGKSILSYCTTSSRHINEKTVSCLSIEDIVRIYFPYSSIEEFIQICRKKEITRFKPEKSTDCDSTLRLVNINQLEDHWNFLLKELIPNTQFSSNERSFKGDLNVNEEKEERIESVLSFPSEENSLERKIILTNDKQCEEDIIQLKKSSEEKKCLDIGENIPKKNSSKKRRRRCSTRFNSSRRRRRRRRTRNAIFEKSLIKEYSHLNEDLFWMKKYSIEPFQIPIDRYKILSD